ncbi:MAG: ASCH domain-containing protein [Phycisphaeraceae bacterium]
MATHIAILQRPYLDLVLAGRKTLESRLTKTAQPPFGVVSPGDRIYLKRSGGPFAAIARAGDVHSYDNLTPTHIDKLRKRFNDRVRGNADYWRMKRNARYATFIELHDVAPIDVGPDYRKSAYKAWFVLPDAADPVLEVALTTGALRNGYVPIAGRADFFGAGDFELHLPDGQRITTDLYRAQRIRWRSWRSYFETANAKPGDLVRFVALGQRRYRVVFNPSPHD